MKVTVVYGSHAGAYPSLPPSIIADLFDSVDDASQYLFRLSGLQFSADVLGAILGPPIAGWIYDSTGSYVGSGLFTAGALMCGLCCLLAMPDQASHELELTARVEEFRAQKIGLGPSQGGQAEVR